MSRGAKLALAAGAVVLCLCSVACVLAYVIGRRAVSQSVAMQPEQAARLGHEIVDYTLPPAYREVWAMKVFDTRWVVIGSDEQNALTIMLMQFPRDSAASQEDMQRQMERLLEQRGQRDTSGLQVVKQQPVTIKGRPVLLTVSESQPETGPALRQVSGVFPGKDGLVMLMAMGEVATWDQAALDAFLASIR